MTDEELLTVLITIKRGIYSKPVKAYINTLIADIKRKQVFKLLDKHCYQSAMSYHLTQETALYGQKNPVKIDVKV